jgi:hypothetical protein
MEALTSPEFLAFIEIYMANVIMSRLLNDIGNKVIQLPDDVDLVENRQNQVKGFVVGAVSDAMSDLDADIGQINTSQTRAVTDDIYKKSYDILARWEDN